MFWGCFYNAGIKEADRQKWVRRVHGGGGEGVVDRVGAEGGGELRPAGRSGVDGWDGGVL